MECHIFPSRNTISNSSNRNKILPWVNTFLPKFLSSFHLFNWPLFTEFHFPEVFLRLLIGASLSEPHTSVTALRTRVYLCLDRPLAVNFKWVHSNISQRLISWSLWRRPWRATVSVQHWGPGAKMTEVKAHVALVCASTDDGRPLTGGKNLV